MLNKSIFSGAELSEQIRFFDLLIDDLKNHFAYEEKVIQQLGFPDFDKHRLIHKTLAAKANTLRSSIDQNAENIADVLSFVFEHLILGHLMKDDTKYFAYTKKGYKAG